MSARHHKADCSCRMCVRLLEQGAAPKSGDRGTLSAKVLRKSLRLLEAELKNPKLTSARRIAIAGKLQKIGNDLARLERQERQVPQAAKLPRIVVEKFRSIYTKRDVYWAHVEGDTRELARAESEQEARRLAREKLAEHEQVEVGSAPVAENQSPDQEHCAEVDKLLAEENMQSSVQKMNVEAPHPQDPPEPVVSSPTSAPALSAEAEAEAFMAEHVDYWPVKENFELMLRWLVANKCKNGSSPWTKQFVLSVSTLNAKADYLFKQGVFTKATLAEAYDALNGLGLLEPCPESRQLKPQPEPAPQPTPASEPPQRIKEILDEKVKASLEELDGYVQDEKLMATLDYTQREKLRSNRCACGDVPQ